MITALKSFIYQTRKRFAPHIRRLLPAENRYLTSNLPAYNWGNPELIFETLTGSLPVFPSYRYTLKPGWLFFKPLSFLHQLQGRALATTTDIQYLQSCIGTRTLVIPISEAEAYVAKRATKVHHHLIPGSLESQTPIFSPQQSEINQRINHYHHSHRNLIRELQDLNFVANTTHLEILEIGFESGGYSLFAFEKLGFSTTGIDNSYGGITEAITLPDFVKNQIGSKTKLMTGDITHQTDLLPNSFDLIYSASVLEHIHDIPAAFTEMYRLLKPGGLLVHKYHPFFCPTGGHALGILDAPWGHCRITPHDYNHYLNTLRPNESEIAQEWIISALTRAFPISKMQQAITESQAEILLWRESEAPQKQLQDLTPEIMQTCFEINPQIGLSDLLTESILFVARKN